MQPIITSINSINGIKTTTFATRMPLPMLRRSGGNNAQSSIRYSSKTSADMLPTSTLISAKLTKNILSDMKKHINSNATFQQTNNFNFNARDFSFPLPLVKCTPIQETSPVSYNMTAPPIILDKVMPTPQIDVDSEVQKDKSMGTGSPRDSGRRKRVTWLRKRPWFHRQWSLNLARARKGPETPTFPNGTPFRKIRTFQAFAGVGWKINTGRRRKIRASLKRGRRRLKS